MDLSSTRGRLARLLIYERSRRGWPQAYVAELSGVSAARISSYETARRNPTLDDLDRILGAMDLQLRVEVEPLWDDFDARCDAVAATPMNERLHGTRTAVEHIVGWLAAAEPVVDGEVAALLQGVPLAPRSVTLTIMQDRLDALAHAMERWPPLRWHARVQDFVFEDRDPRLPGPMRWRSHLGDFEINVVEQPATVVRILLGDREIAVRALHEVEHSDPGTARLIRRVRERYSSSNVSDAAAATPSR